MQHYPTLINSNGQLASSSGELNSENSSLQSLASTDYDTLPPFQRYNRNLTSTVIDHQIGAYNIPNQRTSWDYECLNQMNSAAILGSSESLDAGSVQHLFTPHYSVGQVLRPSRPPGVTSHCYTGSLDRRVLKQRQKEKWKKLGLGSQNNETCNEQNQPRTNSPPLIEAVQLDRSPTRYGANNGDGSKRSASVSYVQNQRTPSSFNNLYERKLSATESVADYHHLPLHRKASNDSTHSSLSTVTGTGSSVELTKPFETSDVLKYSERSRYSPTVLLSNNASSSASLRSPSSFGCNGNVFNARLPQHHAIRRGESLTVAWSPQHPNANSTNRPPSRLQRQNMASVDLLAWYDDHDTTKVKPATIV